MSNKKILIAALMVTAGVAASGAARAERSGHAVGLGLSEEKLQLSYFAKLNERYDFVAHGQFVETGMVNKEVKWGGFDVERSDLMTPHQVGFDFYPMTKAVGFKLGVGLAYNPDKKITGDISLKRTTAQGADAITQNMFAAGQGVDIGDYSYDSANLTDFSVDVEYPEVMPYLGIGIGTPVGDSTVLSMVFEANAFYHGAADVTFNAGSNYTGADKVLFDAAMAEKASEIESELSDKFTMQYRLSLAYQF